MNQRRKFFKQVGAVFAGVAAAVYCPGVLSELFETDEPVSIFGGVDPRMYPQWKNETIQYSKFVTEDSFNKALDRIMKMT